jgi:signal transduction histidine kinase
MSLLVAKPFYSSPTPSTRRACSRTMSPVVLEDFGLQTALESICQQLRGAHLPWH